MHIEYKMIETSSKLSERVYNSNMHVIVALDTQFIDVKMRLSDHPHYVKP